jgi:hypothetical protein
MNYNPHGQVSSLHADVISFTSKSFSFFDDTYIQSIEISDACKGSFSAAYGPFVHSSLTKVVSGFSQDKVFNKTADYSSILETGDEVMVDNRVDSIVFNQYLLSTKIIVTSKIVSQSLGVFQQLEYCWSETLPWQFLEDSITVIGITFILLENPTTFTVKSLIESIP